MRLLVGDDWAEDHHDVEVMDEAGKVLAKRRLPEGAAGIAQLHGLVGGLLGEGAEDAEVLVGIETDRGPWVAALVAAGYLVFAVNPLQAARFRETSIVDRRVRGDVPPHPLPNRGCRGCRCGRLGAWWPPAGEHLFVLGFEPC